MPQTSQPLQPVRICRSHSKLKSILACSFAVVSLNQVPLISFSAEPVADTIAEIVNAREQAAGYVLDIKTRYQAEAPHYIEAKKRYLKTRFFHLSLNPSFLFLEIYLPRFLHRGYGGTIWSSGESQQANCVPRTEEPCELS